jgi:hypothetical protein
VSVQRAPAHARKIVVGRPRHHTSGVLLVWPHALRLNGPATVAAADVGGLPDKRCISVRNA